MRAVFGVFIVGLCVSAGASLTVIARQGETVAAPLTHWTLPTQASALAAIHAQVAVLKHPHITIKPLLVPTVSEFTDGHVSSHRLPKTMAHFPAFFVLSDGARSVQWATDNAKRLKQLRAIGIITHAERVDAIKALEAKTGLVLVPASLTGFSAVVQTTHTPFLVNQGWVVQ